MPSRTNLAASIPSSKVKYSKLACTDEGYIDLQFKKSPPKVPYKAIALATVLFLIGTLLIIIGALLLAGYISQGPLEIIFTAAFEALSCLVTFLLLLLFCLSSREPIAQFLS
ncbi:transmembrane protein 230 isoform X2 [Ahaetulla prasina]|uniref:transmembrane protein 230 isoform X2 n=1 Tax=Ahaetulla prasina TaxID=499056 RepID=UPI00264A0D39|nr:transmembrane protein 230 isoform X2 [Ahaetulla prasina]